MAGCVQCGWDADRTPKHTWTVECAGIIPSQNALGGNHKTGFVYRRYRKFYEHALVELNAVPRANKFRAVLITRVYGKRCRTYDMGNLVGGCKPLVDVLKGFAVILDDRDDCARFYYKQERSADGIDRIRLQILEY